MKNTLAASVTARATARGRLQFAPSAADSLLARAQQAVGTTPRQHLAWLLDGFIYGPDVAASSPDEQMFLKECLASLMVQVTGSLGPGWLHSPPGGDPLALVLGDAQEEGRMVAPQVLSRKGWSWQPLGDVPLGLVAQLLDNAGKGGAPRLFWRWYARPDVAVLHLLVTLAAECLDRLRLCPFRGRGGKPCQRLFVARKRQKWCPAHLVAARQERGRQAQAAFRARARARAAQRQRTKGMGRKAR